MTYKDWKAWLRGKPVLLRLFIIIIFTKPLFDLLWETNIPGTPISFLELFGILLILISIIIIITFRNPRHSRALIFFNIWIGIMVFNAILVVGNNLTIPVLGSVLKYLMPLYLILVFKKLIKTENDLDGILQTFYYSFYITIIVFFISLIQGEYEYTRSAERLVTQYADIASVGMNFNLTFIIAAYFLTIKIYTRSKLDKAFLTKFIFILIAGILILTKIHHGTSWVIFGASVIIFSTVLFKKKAFSFVILTLVLSVPFTFIFKDEVEKSITGLFETDIEIIEGEKGEHMALHGRMGRWEQHIQLYFDQHPVEQAFGFLTIKYPALMGHGTHNDYLRILFSTGYIGLISYLLFIITILIRGLRKDKRIRILTIAIITYVILLSITLTPTTYHAVNFVLLPVVVFVSLRKERINEKDHFPGKTTPTIHRSGNSRRYNIKLRSEKPV